MTNLELIEIEGKIIVGKEIQNKIGNLKLIAKITKDVIEDPYSSITLKCRGNAYEGELSLIDIEREVFNMISAIAEKRVLELKKEFEEL